MGSQGERRRELGTERGYMCPNSSHRVSISRDSMGLSYGTTVFAQVHNTRDGIDQREAGLPDSRCRRMCRERRKRGGRTMSRPSNGDV